MRLGACGLDHADLRLNAHTVVAFRQMLWPHAIEHLLALAHVHVGGHGQGQPARVEGRRTVLLTNRAFDNVHPWRADELRHKQVRGFVVDFQRRADLLDITVAHDDHCVGHCHGFDLVVGDVNRSGFQLLMQFLDLCPHLNAQLGIKVRQRLIKEEYIRVANDSAAHGHPLTLTTRKRLWLSVQIIFERKDLGGPVHALFNRGLVRLLKRHRERHVLAHGHMGVKRVVLEHHRDVTVFGVDIVNDASTNRDFPARDFLQPGKHS